MLAIVRARAAGCLAWTSIVFLALAPAGAHSAQSQGAIGIAAGQLTDALVQLESRTGLRVGYRSGALAGKRTGGSSSASSAQDALAELLKGTGLVYIMRDDRTAVIEDIVRVQATTELEEIVVEGQGRGGGTSGRTGVPNKTGYGPADGFVASRSLTATKTDTPLIETPQAISVISAERLKTQGAQSFGSALRYNAAVSGEAYGPDPRGSFLQLRGFSVDDEIFFRDGLRLSGSEFASFMRLDHYGAERLEILRGPSSVLFGQGAPAGILNYVSKRPTEVTFGEISASVGSFDRYQGEFDFGGPVPGTDGVWSYRLTGLARDGYTQVDHFYDDRVFIAPAVTYKPSEDTTITVLGNYQKDHNGYATQFLPALGTLYRKNGRYIPDSRLTGEPRDHDDQEMAFLGYMFEHKVNDALTVRQNARYAWLRNEQSGSYGVAGYVNPPGASNMLGRIGDFGATTVNSFVVDNQAQLKVDTGPLAHTLLGGVEYRYGRMKDIGADAPVDPIDVFHPRYGALAGPFSLYQDTFVTQKQTGLYAQDQIRLGGWALTFGGRYDWSDTVTRDYLYHKPGVSHRRDLQQDKAFTGRAGLLYLFDNGIAPYVSYSESFFPTVGQNRTTRKPFEPETGEQYEAGVKYQPPGWNSMITAAVFDLTRENVLRDRTVPTEDGPRFETVQGGTIRSRGVEIEGLASLKSGWNASIAYSYTDSEYLTGDDFTKKGATPASIPNQRYSAWSDYTIQSGALAGFGFGGGVRVTGRSWGDDFNRFKVPAFALFDAMVSYKRDGWQFQVNGTNIADKRHVAGCFNRNQCFYGESRKIIAKLTYSWGGSPAAPTVVKY